MFHPANSLLICRAYFFLQNPVVLGVLPIALSTKSHKGDSMVCGVFMLFQTYVAGSFQMSAYGYSLYHICNKNEIFQAHTTRFISRYPVFFFIFAIKTKFIAFV